MSIISIQLYQNDTSKIKQARPSSRVPQDFSSPVLGEQVARFANLSVSNASSQPPPVQRRCVLADDQREM